MAAGEQPRGTPAAQAAIASELEEASRELELADPDAGAGVIDRWINRIAEAAGVLLLAAILLVVFSNAVGRYLLNHSLVWAEEVIIILIPWLAVTGLFLSARRRQMIRVEFFTSRLGPSASAVLAAVSQVLCVFAFAYLAWIAWNYVSVFGRDPTPYLGLPKGLASSALVIGAALVALAFAAALIRDRFGAASGEVRRP